MRFFEQLQQATASARAELQSIPVILDAIQGKVSREEYQRFLTEAYHHVKHTVPLLMACGARIPAQCEWLRTAIAEYIKEEIGHQEWILDDIEACGGDRAQAMQSAPSAATELMVAYAYDCIARGNPAAFFGMVHVLEGTSVVLATRAADAIEHALGLPRTAFSYLRSHGDLDIEHVGFFESLMNRLDDAEAQRAIIHAANMFYRLYGDIFRSLRPASAALAEAA
ncbi:MAG TPA: iron-containing redox enzyme family protein [Aquimonas sp.]|nr:iron-containing redox enzyme family protein [Aquimonas sp.]